MSRRLPHPTFCAVALHGAADLAGGREADADRRTIFPGPALNDHRAAGAGGSLRRSEEFRTGGEAQHPGRGHAEGPRRGGFIRR